MDGPKLERRPIRLLDPACVERIAAGEVVERPASAVKELVENSLDARARHVTVRLGRGGLESIEVEDDGWGIPVREQPLAVERHATSKIAGSGDLGQIRSFGFRGEALASLASVSRFSLRSRAADEEVGGRIEIVGGRLERREPLARHPGTTVTARDLFFNLPARREFLKGEVAERKAVAQVVTNLALAHPEVAFRLEADGKVLLDLPAALDLETRVHGVFGSSVAEQLRRFEGEMEGLRIEGMASLPTHTRGNRSGQHVYVNRRPVTEPGILHAVGQAYREVIPPGRFPVLLLFLELAPARIDVNIHPAKAEIRMRDGGRVHELVRRTLRDALSLRHEPPEGGGGVQPGSPEAGALDRLARTAQEVFLHGPTEGHATSYGPGWSRRKEAPTLFTTDQLGEQEGAFRPAGAPVDPGLGGAGGEGLLFWQLHNTFILTQIRGALVIVDQHNSHERILYNEGKQALEGRGAATQQLLFPATLELSPEELAVYEVHRGDLERVGFLTEPFGGSTVLVRGIPAELRNWNEGALFRDILADLADSGRSGDDPREAILASYACHGAIRAGEKLTLPEMQGLMDRLFATELPYSCPHGRPTLIRIGLPELERRFGRR
jgi:DNA mismatch repair protein MutL